MSTNVELQLLACTYNHERLNLKGNTLRIQFHWISEACLWLFWQISTLYFAVMKIVIKKFLFFTSFSQNHRTMHKQQPPLLVLIKQKIIKLICFSALYIHLFVSLSCTLKAFFFILKNIAQMIHKRNKISKQVLFPILKSFITGSHQTQIYVYLVSLYSMRF